ncbi:MAG: glycosyltransferase [Defluviitaleaceae bacterium]|nr:glycosyltransferase [Defluviitaleaceae bacterium]
MNQEITVSVVLPCYNSAPQLEKCLDSILNQTLREIELICIDDGSTDDTLAILNNHAAKDDRITVLTQENQYAGVARNKGLAVSKGKYVFFMDSDDYLEPTAMEKVYAKSELHQADICLFGAGTLDLTTGKLDYAYPLKDAVLKKLPFSRQDHGKYMMTICHMAAWNKLYNKAFIINSGLDFQPLQRSNDVFFCQTTIIEAKRITAVDAWLYTRTINSGTSLVETMDENPYPFYEASQKIKAYFVEKGLYKHYKKQILQRCLYSAIHVLEKLKTREKFLEVITFLKEVVFIEFEIWENRTLFSLNVTSTKNLHFIMETPVEALSSVRFNHETRLLENEIKVSVIIPCYQSARFLHECLDSLLNQTLKEIEIICIDDGSTDHTVEILASYVKKDMRFKYITQNNQYAGVARNKGMEIARGKYLSFLDSDDFFEPTMLEEMYNQCEKDVADFCVTGGATYDMSTNEVTYKYKVRHEKLPEKVPFSYEDISNEIFSASFIAPWSKLYKKSFIDEHQLHYQALERSNDYFFTQSAMVLAQRITVVDRCLFTYRIGTSTSLVETMDQNPLCFYEANKALYELINERGIYEEVKQSFKRSALSGAHHALSMLKTKEAWLKVALFIKTTYLPEFNLNERPYEYTNLTANLDLLKLLMSSTPEQLKAYQPVLRKDELATIEAKPEFKFELSRKSKKVSIIIPVYNGSRYVAGCLRSVLNQSLKEIEVICVDDGSTDHTLDILKKIANEDERVLILTQENGGQGSARNAGLKVAKGEYIMFVDSDDLLMKMSVEHLYRTAKYNDIDDLFCEGKAFFDPINLHMEQKQQLKNFEYGRSHYPVLSGRDMLQLMLERRQLRYSINIRLFKRQFLAENRLQFTNEPIHEEKIFTMRVLNVAQRVMVYKEPLYFIRIHPNAVTSKANAIHRFDGWGSCVIEALTRAANNVHCEHRQSFINLTKEYQQQMLNRFDEVKKKEPQPSNDMLKASNRIMGAICKDHSSFFEATREKFKTAYASYVVHALELNQASGYEAVHEQRLALFHQALTYMDDVTLNDMLDDVNLDDKAKRVVFNFKATGRVLELAKIYPLSVDRKAVVVKDHDGKVLEKLSQIEVDIVFFKRVGAGIKLSGKLDTLFDFSQLDLYVENDKQERIELKPEQNIHDQEKILGHVSKAPFSFSCYLTEGFLSESVFLIAAYENVRKKLALAFKAQSIIQSDVQGSHLLMNGCAVYYDKEKKALIKTADRQKVDYLRLLSAADLSKKAFNFGDLALAKALQPHLQKEYGKQQINLFIGTQGQSSIQIESLMKHYDSRKVKGEKNYLVIDRSAPNYSSLRKEGISILVYEGFSALKFLLVAKKVFLYEPDECLLMALKEIQEISSDPFEIVLPWRFSNMAQIKKDVQKEFAGKQVNLFMDGVNKADDNAVALIDYFEQNKAAHELNYLILKKTSSDFDDLKKKGINVVEYGGFEHLRLLMIANQVITSQVVDQNLAPFDKEYGEKINYFFHYKVSYIQSGVIEKDMSHELRKLNLNVDLFVTSGCLEFEHVKGKDYGYGEEVVLTGLPRFDKLEKNKGNVIVIAPNWSKADLWQAHSSTGKAQFRESRYFKKWQSLLQNDAWLEVLRHNGFEVVFLPHPNMRDTTWMFHHDQLKIVKFKEKHADLINSACCLITDQNSIYNDFAYAEKQVFYYAPDDNQNFEKSYFDYERDGFGPVVETEAALVAEVIRSMENDFQVAQTYIDRKNEFFAYTDQANCQRVYDAIKALDEKLATNNISLKL